MIGATAALDNGPPSGLQNGYCSVQESGGSWEIDGETVESSAPRRRLGGGWFMSQSHSRDNEDRELYADHDDALPDYVVNGRNPDEGRVSHMNDAGMTMEETLRRLQEDPEIPLGPVDAGALRRQSNDARRNLAYQDHPDVESVRVYGNIHNYAYYFVDLLIGKTNPQRTSVIIDTGSSLCGFPCANCGHCGSHIDAAFDISKSPTAEWVECSGNCNCKSGKCSYYQGYTEGSAISGSWFRDYARLGDTIQHNPPVQVYMGCHNMENKLFYTQKANGIFGLAGPSTTDLRSKPTILADFLRDVKHVNANVFSLCLSQDGGRMIAGGFNSTYHVEGQKDPVYIPMQKGGKYYVVTLSSMSVAGQGQVSGSSYGRTIIDSGTTYTYFPSTQYRDLKSKIWSGCKDCGSKHNHECWNSPGTTPENVDSKWPVVDMTIGGKPFKWYPRSYLFRKGTTNVWCLCFDDNGSHGGSVLGASWMIDRDVVFDLATYQVGIADAHCPQFSANHRPPGPKEGDLANDNYEPSAVPVPTKAEETTTSTTTSTTSTTTTSSSKKPEPAPAPVKTDGKNVERSTPKPTGTSTESGMVSQSESKATPNGAPEAEANLNGDAWMPSYKNPPPQFEGGMFQLGIAFMATVMLLCTVTQCLNSYRNRQNYFGASAAPNGSNSRQWMEVGVGNGGGLPGTGVHGQPLGAVE